MTSILSASKSNKELNHVEGKLLAEQVESRYPSVHPPLEKILPHTNGEKYNVLILHLTLAAELFCQNMLST